MTPVTEGDTTRDPHLVAERAHTDWTTWHPGDGSSYQVRVTTITDGPDHADQLLLLNIHRRTVAFQWSNADYRHRENGPWRKKRARDFGIADWWWDAAKPLLDVLGATRDPDKSPRVTAPAVVTVALPEPTKET